MQQACPCPCNADNLFEEVEPATILDTRANENGTRDFLVKWRDGAEDSWVRPAQPLVSCARVLKSLPATWQRELLASGMQGTLPRKSNTALWELPCSL